MKHLEEFFIKPQNEVRIRNVYALVISKSDSLYTDSPSTSPEGNMSIKQFISLLWETRLVDKPIVNDSGLPDDTIVNIEIPTQVYQVDERLASIGMWLEFKVKRNGLPDFARRCAIVLNINLVSYHVYQTNISIFFCEFG